MLSKISYRLIIFIIAAIFGIIFSAPSLMQSESGSKINLGLDLQGGLHMLLEVESDEAIASKIKSIASSVNYSAKKDDLFVEKFRIEKNHFEFSILDPDEAPKFDAILNQITMTALTAAQQEYLTYTIKYAGNTYTATTANNLNISLPASSSNTAEVEVTAAYVQPESADDLPASDVVVSLSAQFHYDQAE
mgnify:CR=1 FL=1